MPGDRKIRLLVVEDSPAYRYLIQKAFAGRVEQTRWDLTTVEDGADALRVLFSEEQHDEPLPDLILLDWNLPKVSGMEVLRQVKEHKNLRCIPILIFSVSDADEDIQRAYAGHANGYITKPNDLDILGSIVTAIEQFWITVARLPNVVR